MAHNAPDISGSWEAAKTQAELHDLLPQELKPCVAMMLQEGPPGGECDPNTTCYIIATEFRRLGKDEADARQKLLEWAMAIDRGRALRPREIEKTVASAYGGDLRTYGCNPSGKLYRSGYCLGHENCHYYKRCGGRKDHDELSFYRFGWPEKIGAPAASLYNGIRALEFERQVPGGTTFATYRQLRQRSGCSLGWIKKGLEKLQAAGLIDFTPGQVGSVHGQATEIKRVLPIPEPPPKR